LLVQVEDKLVAHRIKQIIDLLTPEGVQRVRNMEDGDEIDINAAIDAMVAIRMGEQPNPRTTMRNVLKNRDLSVVLLLDLSESTNETLGGSDKTVLQLTRDAPRWFPLRLKVSAIRLPFTVLPLTVVTTCSTTASRISPDTVRQPDCLTLLLSCL
jgi:nitric oxide reductase activation protein